MQQQHADIQEQEPTTRLRTQQFVYSFNILFGDSPLRTRPKQVKHISRTVLVAIDCKLAVVDSQLVASCIFARLDHLNLEERTGHNI